MCASPACEPALPDCVLRAAKAAVGEYTADTGPPGDRPCPAGPRDGLPRQACAGAARGLLFGGRTRCRRGLLLAGPVFRRGPFFVFPGAPPSLVAAPPRVRCGAGGAAGVGAPRP